MADRIKGITIEIGGDTTGLNKALGGVNKEISSTQSKLKDVERLLKLDPSNVELLSQKQKLLADASEETKKKLEALKEANRQAAESASNYDSWKEKYDPIKEQIEDTKKKLNQLKEQSKEADAQLSSGEISQEAYDAIQEEIKQTSDELKNLQKSAKEVSDEFGHPISPEQYDALQREIIETENNLKSLERQAEKSNVTLERIGAAGESMKNFGKSISEAGEKFLPLSAAVGAIGGVAIKTTADFDSAMSQVAAISGARGKDFDTLRDKAREMGEKTKFSASEAADAFQYMAMAGWKVEDMLGGIEGIMNLSAASGEDLASTSDIVTDALTAFGLTAKDSGHFTDVLASASSNANTNVSMMGETFKYVAPVAGALKYSAEDVAVAIGLMANSGIKGSEAGTQLRTAFVNMVNPTDKMYSVMQQLGIEISNNDGSMKSWDETMHTLRGAFAGMTEEQQASYAATLFGKEAMSGMLAIINASEEDYEKLTKAIANCDGTCLEMSEIMEDNLNGQLKKLGSQIAEIGISIGDALIPVIRKLISHVQSWADWFNKLSDKQKMMVITIGAIVAAIAPLLIAIGKISTGVGALMTLIGKMGPLLTLLGSPGGQLFAIAAAGTAVAFVLEQLLSSGNSYTNSVKELSEEEEKNKAKVDELYESYQQLDLQRREGIESAEQQAQYEQALFQELQGLADENGVVKAGYEERARFITGELSNALGIEMEMTDGQIQNYKELCAGIDELILKKEANALLDSQQAAYTEAIKNQTDAFMAYNDAQKNVEEAKKQLNEAQRQEARYQMELNALQAQGAESGEDISSAISNLTDKIFEQAVKVKDYGEKISGLNQTFSQAEDAYVGYNTTIANYEGLSSAIISGEQEKISEAVLNTIGDFKTAETATREALEQQVATFTEKYEAMRKAVESGAPGITQVQVEQWGELLRKSKEELDKLPKIVSDSTSNAANSARIVTSEYQKLGGDYAAGTAKGISDGKTDVEAAATELAKSSVEAARTALDSHSPSREMVSVGHDFDDGLKVGVEENTGGVINAVQTLSEQMKVPFLGINAEAKGWGVDMMDGYISGIRSKTAQLERACEGIARTVSDYIHFSRPEKGPLREYEKWMPDMMKGLSNGIDGNMWRITGRMQKLSEHMADSMNGNSAGVDLSKIENLLSYYLPNMNRGGNIVLDDGTLVGKMMPKLDSGLSGSKNLRGRNGV